MTSKLDRGTNTRPYKKRLSYDLPDLASLPPGQRRAVEALIGSEYAITYPEAASVADMAEGTLLTHLNRIRKRHPKLYKEIREVRLTQLAERHEDAQENAKEHSRMYFRRRKKWMRRLLGWWV